MHDFVADRLCIVTRPRKTRENIILPSGLGYYQTLITRLCNFIVYQSLIRTARRLLFH